MKRLAFKAAPLLAALALAGCASISPDGLRGDFSGGPGGGSQGGSLHTVWFELHEDLIATLGISR